MVSINITNTSILPRCKYSYYKQEYITQMEVLTLQTRVYYRGGRINITNTSILPSWKCYILQTRGVLPRRKY